MIHETAIKYLYARSLSFERKSLSLVTKADWVTTGFTEEVVKVLTLGGDNFLAKPYTLEGLREALDHFHSRHDIDFIPKRAAQRQNHVAHK